MTLPENNPKVEVILTSMPILPMQIHKAANVEIPISKILSRDETGNFTAMTLDNHITITSSGNTLQHLIQLGNYIVHALLRYLFGGIVLIYT